VSESKVRAASRAICSFEPQLKSRALIYISRPIAKSLTSGYAKTAKRCGSCQYAALPKLARNGHGRSSAQRPLPGVDRT
jgi:hypothetical protein